jgi:hypothetical protein
MREKYIDPYSRFEINARIIFLSLFYNLTSAVPSISGDVVRRQQGDCDDLANLRALPTQPFKCGDTKQDYARVFVECECMYVYTSICMHTM